MDVWRDVLGRGVPDVYLGAVPAAVPVAVPVARGAAGISTVGSDDAAFADVEPVEVVAGGGLLAGFEVEGLVPGRWRRRLALLT